MATKPSLSPTEAEGIHAIPAKPRTTTTEGEIVGSGGLQRTVERE